MTKADHPETIAAAKEFKQLLDETLLTDVPKVNPTPFEEFVYNTGGRVSQLLARLISAYEN